MVAYIVYIIYLITSLWLMIVVGNSLHRNGRIWIIDLLTNIHLSDKVNNTLLLLYRLVNVGYILITLMSGHLNSHDAENVIELLSVKLGLIISVLAYLHFQNIFLLILFSKLKSKYKWEI